MNDITAIILTKNEELNIERCINSVKGWVDRIVIVDSGSTDKTIELALSLGAEVYRHEPFVNYAKQFNWSIDNVEIKTTWVFRLDADEVVPDDLCDEIVAALHENRDTDVSGMMMRYKVFFMGRFLTHGGIYPFLKITIFKYGKGRFEDRYMGEHIVLSEGRVLNLRHECLHYDFKNLSSWISKHNWYATREVIDYFDIRRGRGVAILDGQPEKARKLRDGLYYKLPKFLRARFYFWYRYYFRLGFLDGKAGYIHAFLQAYWYRFLVDAKIMEEELKNKNEK